MNTNGMSLLAETAAVTQDAEAAAKRYELLVPSAALNAGDHPEGIRGSAFTREISSLRCESRGD